MGCEFLTVTGSVRRFSSRVATPSAEGIMAT